MKTIHVLILLAVQIISFSTKAQQTESFTDLRDNIIYKTVKIGTQTWMTENLNFSTSSGSWCYENNTSNCAKYGRLYDWETAKKVCPSGWHLPSDAEWTKLTTYLGGEDAPGTKMKSTSGWNDNEGKSGNGNNTSGFAGLPGGYRNYYGPFDGVGSGGLWWSSTEYDTFDAWGRYLGCSSGRVYRNDYSKLWGLSVRCLRD